MMQFQTLEQFQGVASLLEESDFERGDWIGLPPPGSFVLSTSRLPEEKLRAGGLFRKKGADWIPCRLTFRSVRAVSVREEYDVASKGGMVAVEPAGEGGFRILLSSPRGLRLELTVDRLEGTLEDADHPS